MSTPYAPVPNPNDSHAGRGQAQSGVADFAHGNPAESSPLSQSLGQQSRAGQLHDDMDASRRGSSALDDSADLNRSASTASTAVNNNNTTPSRSNTLRKKPSIRRTGSLRRSSSRKSLKAGSIKGVGGGAGDDQEFNSVFNTPIPTQGSPVEVLADRFGAWRQLLKSLIAYFREIQASYDTRAKALHKVQNTLSNLSNPSVFASDRGLGEATRILDDYHKHSISEANKSRDIEDDVIAALTGLRSDLGQKIKEIKSLSGDFKNSVEKEKDTTRREVEKLQEALQHADHEDGSATGKNDPFVVRLGVDRAVEKQIDEENYLHRAYLNLESSGRELESIVVGEIQKAYKALAGILRREGDDAYSAAENLRSGPIGMPKDQEWMHFVNNDPHFVAPEIPLRRIDDIQYPGKGHVAAAEIRGGMLERKSKYLKSYTPGWYVLSPTHLHEFKSADKIYTQPPVMSLYLPDQRLGSHSDAGSSSHKFMLKGRQTGGGVHKGHSWVFRAESHDTMVAWFQDIKILTEKSPEERNAFVRRHTRSISGASDRRRSFSSDGLDDDDADAVPYSADAASLAEQHPVAARPQRPQPGGRFPSDVQIPKAVPASPSSGSSGLGRNRSTSTAAAAAIISPVEGYQRSGADPYRLDGVPAGSRNVSGTSTYDDDEERYMSGGAQPTPVQQPPGSSAAGSEPVKTQLFALPAESRQQPQQAMNPNQAPVNAQPQDSFPSSKPTSDPRPSSDYGDWIAPAAAAGAGVGAGILGKKAYDGRRDDATVAELGGKEVSPVEDTTPSGGAAPATATTTPTAAAAAVTAAAPTSSAELRTAQSDHSTAATPGGISGPSESAVATQARSGGGLRGLEKDGAHETGQFSPKVLRHDTDISVSALHVPGQFPRRG